MLEIQQQFLPLLYCVDSKGTMGERKEKYIHVQVSALHFDFFAGMVVLVDAFFHFCCA